MAAASLEDVYRTTYQRRQISEVPHRFVTSRRITWLVQLPLQLTEGYEKVSMYSVNFMMLALYGVLGTLERWRH